MAAQPRPFVKWVGGKCQLLSILHSESPERFNRYFEPFVGGGAYLFSKTTARATISDKNEELINCYRVIRDDVEALIISLLEHRYDESYYYFVRAQKTETMTTIERASRFIFLNKTCFNGLYREKTGVVNSMYRLADIKTRRLLIWKIYGLSANT